MDRALVFGVIASLASSCYREPSLASCKYMCGGASNVECPSNFECIAGRCVAPGEGCDGDGGIIDADTDAPIDMSTCPITFVASPPKTAQTSPRALVALNVTVDGLPDIVVTDDSQSNGATGLFVNQNGGNFADRTTVNNGSQGYDAAPADIDVDGQRDDLALLKLSMSTNAQFSPLINSGGSFTGVNYSLANSTTQLVVVDADLDGRDDIAILNPSNQDVVFYRHRLTPDDWQLQSSLVLSAMPTQFAVGELDGGALDLVVVYASSNTFELYTGGVAFSFSNAGSQPVGSNPSSIAVGRLRPIDGQSVVTANTGSSNVSVRHLSSGTSFVTGGELATGSEPVAVILADVNGDLHLDIVTANRGSNNVSVLLNNGSGAFAASQNFATGTGPVDVVAADFDMDGKLDLATANEGSNNISILLQRCQ